MTEDTETLAAQLRAAQEVNTALIARIVELEHERDRAMAVVSCAVSLVGYARGVAAHLPPLTPVNFVTGGHYRALAAAVAAWEQRWESAAPPHDA